jgi:predicted phage-related endonuclease
MQKFRRTSHIGMSDEVKQARRSSIGGSDARIIMSGNQKDIENLWREKRGEQVSQDLSEVLVVALGNITEALNTDWFEFKNGLWVTDEQSRPSYKDWPVAMSTLDGLVRHEENGPAIGVFEAKFMLPFYWSLDEAVAKYMPQVQHNMMVTGIDKAWLSIITGGGQYACQPIEADDFYQIQLLEAEKDFWDCVQTGRTPGVPEIEAPKVEPVKTYDMTGNNEWATFATIIGETYRDWKRHDENKKSIKSLMPEDAIVADGHGVKLKRSKDGKVLFEIEAEKEWKAEEAARKKAEKAAAKGKRAA